MPKLPFEFVLEELLPLEPTVKQMFGCHAIYVGETIVAMLRDRPKYKQDNGVWVATYHTHHESLKKDFPSMRSISVFGPEDSSWQVLPVESEDFEESAVKMCAFILEGDPRIGRIPKKKRPRKKL